MNRKRYLRQIIQILLLVIMVFVASCKQDKFEPPTPKFAVKFDGIDGQVVINNSADLNPESAITIAMWVRLEEPINCDQNDYERALIIKGVAEGYNPTGYNIRVNCDGALNWRVGTEGGLMVYGTGTGLVVNEWTFLTFVYDTSTSEASIYINGNQDLSGGYAPWITSSGSMVSNVSDISVNMPNSVNYPNILNFPGSIDDVSIWNVALTPEQITKIKSGVEGTETGLISYWSFNEGKDSTAFDVISHHDGLLKGGVSWAAHY